MKSNQAETVYIIGESRTNLDNAITVIYNSFYLAFEVDVKTDVIIDAGCSHTIQITEDFIKKLFVGKKLTEFEPLGQEILRRYHGTSQKAIIVSYKDAIKKYQEVKTKFFD
ncbi:MAG: DUF3870 domain-containing protein [Clostridiaceae bacterium]